MSFGIKMKYNPKEKSLMGSFFIWVILVCILPDSGYTQTTSSAREIVLKAVGGLQYDVVRFQVAPGEKIRLVLENTDDMDHNLVITKPGKRAEIVKAALEMGDRGPAKYYVPESPLVLHHIKILSPGEETSLSFTAPKSEGVYPYVCTYPGHGVIMYGAMYVTKGKMPPLSEDLNIPEIRRGENGRSMGAKHQDHEKKWHPYELVPPYFYRIFMPQSGPASIAVRLTDDVAYCWDAGTCRLRYIWNGDFLDISEPWSIKGDAKAKVLGTVFYRDNEEYPLRIGSEPPETDYLGFRLVDGGFPEFYYDVNGFDVYELIQPAEDGSGITRHFSLPDVKENVVFTYTSEDGAAVTSDVGVWEGSRLILSPDEARSFTVFIKPSSK